MNKVIYGADLLCFFFEDADKFFADYLTLCFGFCDAFEPCVIAFLRIYTDKVEFVGAVGAEYCFHFISFVFA